MERIVRAGEFYRHFKNKLYQIVTVAIHSETGEKMVVYQALYGDYKTYVRPYEMFVSEVDREKYPDVKQKYRFERVVFDEDLKNQVLAVPEVNEAEMEQQANPYLLEFLDADCFEKQMECLKHLADSASQTDLDSIYLVLDIKRTGDTIAEQIGNIRRYLSMQHHFDGQRLR